MKQNNLRSLCECALFTAAAMVLSYLEIPLGISFGGFGGSLSLVMIPLVLCAVRWGLVPGLCTGFAFGLLKYFFSGGWALNVESMLLDYTVAYMAVGLAGVLRCRANTAWLAALIGCFARFLVHFVSGITIYAAYAGPIFGIDGGCVIYSILYNGSYMLPNTVLTVVSIALLSYPLGKFLRCEDLRSLH
ncbi:MAG: energy-coupled thiamine transporter ThiT [Ruminococcaceae bacterium]|nr:energy-coupled thiamine transporter ThiT [Oscillospiraceae bacterium]